MKNKLDVTNLVKIAGWIAVAVGGLMASWASDKQQQEQTEKSVKEYYLHGGNGRTSAADK